MLTLPRGRAILAGPQFADGIAPLVAVLALLPEFKQPGRFGNDAAERLPGLVHDVARRGDPGAPDWPYAASTAASRSITIGHPARMPSNAVLPIGVSRSKPACSSDSRVPSPSGARDQVMTVFSTPGANA